MNEDIVHQFLYKISVWGFISLFTLAGCGKSEKPENLIEEDTYIDILVELQLTRTHHNALPDSVNADSLIQLIYEKYDVDENQFVNSHTYYQTQVRSQLGRTDNAIERLQEEQQRIEDRMDSLRADTTQKDTVRIGTRRDMPRDTTHRDSAMKE